MEISLDYYDLVLGGIGASLLTGGFVGFLTSIPLQYSFGAGAAVSIALMYDGMFRNGPIG
mgnify:FL=1